MTREEYLLYIEGAINSYSTKEKEYLKELFIENSIAYDKLQIKINDKNISAKPTESIDITDLEVSEQIEKCISDSKEAVKILEDWEFIKNYKYSVIYTVESNFEDLILNITNSSNIIKKNKISDECGYMFDFEKFDSLEPIIRENNDTKLLFLKYNLKFEAIHPQTQEEMLVKYPLLVIIHKAENLIEFRFDNLNKIFFFGNKRFYLELVYKTADHFNRTFNADIIPLDLDFMIAKSKNHDKIKLIAQYIKTADGGHARLEVGNNEKYILPFIGELNLLMQENKSEFDKAPFIKGLLEQFIHEKEETSDYPWITVLWENEIKTRSTQVKFTFNYANGNFCLLQHYYNNILLGMERMNNVVRFIGENRRDYPKPVEPR